MRPCALPSDLCPKCSPFALVRLSVDPADGNALRVNSSDLHSDHILQLVARYLYKWCPSGVVKQHQASLRVDCFLWVLVQAKICCLPFLDFSKCSLFI